MNANTVPGFEHCRHQLPSTIVVKSLEFLLKTFYAKNGIHYLQHYLPLASTTKLYKDKQVLKSGRKGGGADTP